MSTCGLPRIHRPCDECPWRKDAEPGRFLEERWMSLKATSRQEDPPRGPEIGDPLFACHKTDEGRDRLTIYVDGVSEGNPLFVEQMLALAVEGAPAAAIPPTIHALLAARLDQLPAEPLPPSLHTGPAGPV